MVKRKEGNLLTTEITYQCEVIECAYNLLILCEGQ